MPRQRKQSNLAPKKKMASLLYLTGKAVNGLLPYRAKASASRVFLCHRDTVTTVWSKRAAPEVLLARSCRRSNGLRYPGIDGRVEKAPLPLRQAQRSLSQAVGVPRTTIQH
ncbi:hypothetical protein JG687_00017276 [Phytophthora cactorum]|uniref:Uncharacterized protein n=1 Tax=Phytophthora cactorum TaxID=29920 RepID=A0A329RCB7_9STRA|nr:hypothetical protein Pcac1_g8052 [Phytophthora cactorum]KAG2809908.1 hypothetical protein PC112_g16288 [Phytophthora cactorum]KAG2881254.1 hypothetical protein PC115_g22283 [Phytophthora cactorum]KAG2889403.1 hypothetical protein PC114_g17955 [Phytophthora cactorum]KAG2917423.1 hypothetical protein PC117_g17448 [Phytophthora cactorum]